MNHFQKYQINFYLQKKQIFRGWSWTRCVYILWRNYSKCRNCAASVYLLHCWLLVSDCRFINLHKLERQTLASYLTEYLTVFCSHKIPSEYYENKEVTMTTNHCHFYLQSFTYSQSGNPTQIIPL